MKAQDLLILLKIIAFGNKQWSMSDLSKTLFLSQSEVSKALERLSYSGLLDELKKTPAKKTLYELILNSVKYIFPVRPGRILKGFVTAHSAEPLSKIIRSESIYIWPDANGDTRGESIGPLYKSAPRAAIEDKKLYEMLALIDTLRVGKAREQTIARKELKKRFDLV